jgi:hypothetical protein
MTGKQSGAGYPGQASYWASTSEYNAQVFLVQQILGSVRTATLVQIKAVSNTDTVSPVGTVDVLPLVNMMDGLNNASKHITVYGLPYFRLQGGKNAIIVDPQVGDIGIAVFADRDISAVKANKKQSNPGSGRRFDMADGIYIGGVLNAAPTQYVQFTIDGSGNPNGINIFDANGNKVEMSSTGTKITDLNGNIMNMTSAGFAFTTTAFKVNGVNVGDTHKHSGVQTGGGNTGNPV